MPVYTVLGYYEDTGQCYAMPVKDAHQAMREAAKAADEPSTLWVIGAVEGRHALHTPGEDNASVACATDMAGED